MNRILVKISGEYFDEIDKYLTSIFPLLSSYTIIFMCGGGNWIRGRDVDKLHRTYTDRIGMLSTVANAIKLKTVFDEHNLASTIFSTIETDVSENYNVNKILDKLQAKPSCHNRNQPGHIIILAGGLGCGYISTDTAMVVRGLELRCESVIKATKVGGVYDKDPKLFKDANIIKDMSYEEALSKDAFDKSSICIAMEHNLPFGIVDLGQLSQFLIEGTIGTKLSR